MNDKLAIITPTINPPVLVDFLKSVEKQRDKNFHVFIVDITGTGTTQHLNSPRITLIKEKNKGYSYSVNKGLERAVSQGFTKFCVINDDTFFEDDFVEKALSSLGRHPGSLLGGKIYYAAGYEYHKEKYNAGDKGRVIWYAGGTFDWDHVLSNHVGVDEVDSGQFESERETAFITGALMLFDKNALDRVGFWDESYFLYFEDADYCIRATNAGIKLYYDPSVVIWHKVSQSTEGSGSELHVRYQTKNRLKFGLKYAPVRTKIHLLKNFFLGSFSKK